MYRIAHFEIPSDDPERSMEFYTQFELVWDNPRARCQQELGVWEAKPPKLLHFEYIARSLDGSSNSLPTNPTGWP